MKRIEIEDQTSSMPSNLDASLYTSLTHSVACGCANEGWLIYNMAYNNIIVFTLQPKRPTCMFHHTNVRGGEMCNASMQEVYLETHMSHTQPHQMTYLIPNVNLSPFLYQFLHYRNMARDSSTEEGSPKKL